MYSSLDIVLAVVSMFVYVLGPIIPDYSRLVDYSWLFPDIVDRCGYWRLLWITEDSLVI